MIICYSIQIGMNSLVFSSFIVGSCQVSWITLMIRINIKNHHKFANTFNSVGNETIRRMKETKNLNIQFSAEKSKNELPKIWIKEN